MSDFQVVVSAALGWHSKSKLSSDTDVVPLSEGSSILIASSWSGRSSSVLNWLLFIAYVRMLASEAAVTCPKPVWSCRPRQSSYVPFTSSILLCKARGCYKMRSWRV
eukprot:3007148-Ditylum_brightwellii.AAC.1